MRTETKRKECREIGFTQDRSSRRAAARPSLRWMRRSAVNAGRNFQNISTRNVRGEFRRKLRVCTVGEHRSRKFADQAAMAGLMKKIRMPQFRSKKIHTTDTGPCGKGRGTFYHQLSKSLSREVALKDSLEQLGIRARKTVCKSSHDLQFILAARLCTNLTVQLMRCRINPPLYSHSPLTTAALRDLSVWLVRHSEIDPIRRRRADGMADDQSSADRNATPSNQVAVPFALWNWNIAVHPLSVRRSIGSRL